MRLLLACVATLTAFAVTGAHADEFHRIHYTFGEWCGCTSADIGVWSEATDGYDDTADHQMNFGVWPGYAAMYHINEPGVWEGPSGFYDVDLRSIPDPNESKTWSPIYVWAVDSWVGDTMPFSVLIDIYNPMPTDRVYTLELLATPKSIDWPAGQPTSWIVPQDPNVPLTIYMPTYRTSDGLESYQFALNMSAVIPEPASGLLLGLLLAGLTSRRGGW